MPHHTPTVAEIDRDGALQEAAYRVSGQQQIVEAAERGDTRASMLRKAAMGGGALMGGGLLLGLPTLALGADTRSLEQDIEILNFALTLEYLEAAFYTEAEKTSFPSARLNDFAKIVGQHEREHVEFLANALGDRAVARPTFDFRNTTSAQALFIDTAVTLEDTGVAAYLGQSFRLQRTSYILAAASVLAVEARHSAFARELSPVRQPTEEAFATRATMNQVLAAVTSTGFIVSS